MYIADLHIHSRYSRATSRDCTPEYLDLWARRKGIAVVGTGDFTHPAWREELREKLTAAEPGMYRLKEEYRIRDGITDDCASPRFVVTGEISSIYKKAGKVRKVHSLILLPGLEAAEQIAKKLETIGNLHSDGRPILGLDCHDLLEILLELCPEAVYIPAHIWTPHFSMFGAFSGFDTVEECFGDLSGQIHALETGLSSDPPMNWRLSALDSYQLVSNSDAHSPSKLGREANLLDTELSYPALAGAIQTGKGLAGTIEFFPEEGKYHYDGHRKCGICLSPAEAARHQGICPVCGKRLTIGVSHRVEELADREEGFLPSGAKTFESLTPLPEVIAASTGKSAAGLKVQRQYEEMLKKLGNEFSILREIPEEEIRRAAGTLIAEGVCRLRNGDVKRIPGFDGEYGTIELFDPWERDSLDGQISLFTPEEYRRAKKTAAEPGAEAESDGTAAGEGPSGGEEVGEGPSGKTTVRETSSGGPAAREWELQGPDLSDLSKLNEKQREAVTAVSRAIAVTAGPGTGKTRTLVSRIVYLLKVRKAKPSEITAVTFTNKAAGEIRERLERQLGGKRAAKAVNLGTFHSVCRDLLHSRGIVFQLADEDLAREFAEDTIQAFGLDLTPGQLLRKVSWMKNGAEEPAEWFEDYQTRLRGAGAFDFDDLLLETLSLLKAEEERGIQDKRFTYLLVDEFQDISPVQYSLLKAWNRDGRELFVIGDPDQSIYGFRGSDSRCFARLSEDYQSILTVRLEMNYRSAPSILRGSLAVIGRNPGPERILDSSRGEGARIRLVTAKTRMSEAIFAAKEVGRLIGGIDMLDIREAGRAVSGFSDIAVLYRTRRQAALLEKCFRQEGIPYIVVGRDDFLSDPAVRGTACYFRWLLDPQETLAGRQALRLLWKDGGEEGKIREKYQGAAKRKSPVKLLREWMEDMGLEGNEPMEKLLEMACFYKTMPEFLHNLRYGRESDLRRFGGKTYTLNAVTLMTLHGSKGLEFPAVILCGVSKGLIPMESGGGQGAVDLEEERRLFYVGMTRAMDELILTAPGEESEFLADIPEAELKREEASRQKNRDADGQLSLFDFLDGGKKKGV